MVYIMKLLNRYDLKNHLIMLEKVHYYGNGCGFNVINQLLVSCTV